MKKEIVFPLHKPDRKIYHKRYKYSLIIPRDWKLSTKKKNQLILRSKTGIYSISARFVPPTSTIESYLKVIKKKSRYKVLKEKVIIRNKIKIGILELNRKGPWSVFSIQLIKNNTYLSIWIYDKNLFGLNQIIKYLKIENS